MAIDNDIIGYGIVTRGGGRNKFCTRKDIVLCSLWISPLFRGNGYANTLVKTLISELNIQYEKAYEYIRHDNIPSVKVALANGFIKVGNATHKGILKSIVCSEIGHLGIYQFQYKAVNGEKTNESKEN